MDLIIFAHPDNKSSHNAAILRHVVGRLKAKHAAFEVIDLYADGFDPVFRLTAESPEKVALVKKYQTLVAGADRMIFIHPVWWYNVPAILNGFLEHVFNSGFAYAFRVSPENTAIVEHRLGGKTAIVMRTYGRTKAEAEKHGNPPRLVLEDAVLGFCGVKVAGRVEWFDVRPPSILPKAVVNEIDSLIA